MSPQNLYQTDDMTLPDMKRYEWLHFECNLKLFEVQMMEYFR